MADLIPHCGSQMKTMEHCDGCPEGPAKQAPCKDMTPACATAVGCIAVLGTTQALDDFDFALLPGYSLGQRILTGRVIKPGLEPPILAA